MFIGAFLYSCPTRLCNFLVDFCAEFNPLFRLHDDEVISGLTVNPSFVFEHFSYFRTDLVGRVH